MKTTGTKKPCQTTNQMQGLVAITERCKHMSNITHFSNGKQVQVSEHQLLRLLESIRNAKIRFAELQALAGVIAEKSSKHSTTETLARLASEIANISEDDCLEEFKFFKEFSPQLASLFAEELAA
jgi:hypothetical protein